MDTARRSQALYGIVALALIFAPMNLLRPVGWPGWACLLAGGWLLSRLRIHHTVADPVGLISMAVLVVAPAALHSGLILKNALLLGFAGVAVYSGRSGWGTRAF